MTLRGKLRRNKSTLVEFEVIVPEPPRSVLSVGWSGDNLLLTYSDGSNQTISTPVC